MSKWIKTQTNDELILQKKNRLKGLAMQSFVSSIIQEKYDANKLSDGEDTVQKISEKAEDVLDELFDVKKTVMISDDSGENYQYFPKNSGQFDYNDYTIDITDFKFPIQIFTRKDTIGSTLGYRGCYNCYYAIPKTFCKKCGGAVFEDRFKILSKIKDKYNHKEASKLFNKIYDYSFKHYKEDFDKRETFLFNIKWIKESHWNEGLIKFDNWSSYSQQQFCTCNSPIETEHSHSNYPRCPECGKTSFKDLEPGFELTEFEFLTKANNEDEASKCFKENDLVTKNSCSKGFSKKRLDNWLITEDSNEIFIIETKNYEDTSLDSDDLRQVLKYVKAINESGIAKPSTADIIYNGGIAPGLEDYIDYHYEDIDTKLNSVDLKDFCREIGIFPKVIEVAKDLENPDKVLGEFKVSWNVSNDYVKDPKLRIIAE
jgi:hypothetical protein